jgi:hypothetical protein
LILPITHFPLLSATETDGYLFRLWEIVQVADAISCVYVKFRSPPLPGCPA